MLSVLVVSGFPYHVWQEGEVLSLQFANPDRSAVENKLEREREEAGEEVSEFRSEIICRELDMDIYGLYTTKIYPREFEEKQFAQLSPEEELLIGTVLEGFEAIEEECAVENRPLKWYKKPDIPTILEQINRVQWKQNVPNVGGHLLSNLIIGHGLPNANHRTSISFLETYLQSFEPDFEVPDTGIHGEWYDWSEEFVRESKRLLTLSRKAPILCYLDEWGCSALVRKNDNEIDFTDYSLHVENPHDYFRQKHREMSTEFVYQILERTEYNHLIAKEDLGKTVFIDRLTAD